MGAIWALVKAVWGLVESYWGLDENYRGLLRAAWSQMGTV